MNNIANKLIMAYTITKLPESGVLCGNITVFGVEDHLTPQGEGGPPPPQTK